MPSKKKLKLDPTQNKLTSFVSLPSKRLDLDTSEPGPSPSLPESETAAEKSVGLPKTAAEDSDQTPRKYNSKWEGDFDWLRYDSAKNKMFCKLCEENGKNNAFTGEGCDNWRKSSAGDHIKTKDHRLSEQAFVIFRFGTLSYFFLI